MNRFFVIKASLQVRGTDTDAGPGAKDEKTSC